MAFTSEEEAKCRYYLSYPDWISLAQSFQLGYPANAQPLFLLNESFKRIRPESEYTVRRALCELDSIECQMSAARQRLQATALGELKLNPMELSALRKELLYWTARLADALGVVANPYSQMIFNAISQMGGVGGRSMAS